MPETPAEVLTLNEADRDRLTSLLLRYGLQLVQVEPGAKIPGSYWGAEEAGLVADQLLARADTPVHSILHETCHFTCMDPQRRKALDTDAGGDFDEENGVCYLQILLADFLPEMGRERMMSDMDHWGYSFRLGSARAWFETDADDARAWLQQHGLIDEAGTVTWALRTA